MSISSALSNALSGLNARSREAELISNNVANALTPGYTRRTAELSQVVVDGRGSGVSATVRIEADPVTTAARRRSDADLGVQSTMADALGQVISRFGLPGEAGALAERAASFESALLSAASEPSSEAALRDVVTTAEAYTKTFTLLSTEVQRSRMDLDAQIAVQVQTVNKNLQSIEMLNQEIRLRTFAGDDASALVDQRKSLVDGISQILPIRSVERQGGEVALYTKSGATLLDGRASQIGFTATPTISQAMSIGAGDLSGLQLNGQDVRIGAGGPLNGGSLGALFELRDSVMPQISGQLDALAADLIGRFQDAAVDPTIGGGTGLFTDNGNAFAAANTEGIASRVQVSAAVKSEMGGDPAKLRDGLGSSSPGPVGDGSLLNALYNAAVANRSAPGLGSHSPAGTSGLAASLTDTLGGRQKAADSEVARAAAVNTSLRESEGARTGVNTDVEMQRLLVVEQGYAANARVLQVVDDMINRLLEI